MAKKTRDKSIATTRMDETGTKCNACTTKLARAPKRSRLLPERINWHQNGGSAPVLPDGIDQKKKLNAVVNMSMPSNIRGPVYNTMKMGNLHWRIQIPLFLGGRGERKTGLLLGRQLSEKNSKLLSTRSPDWP